MEFIIKNKICTDKKLKYQYFIDVDHPLANKQGKVYLHRHIISLNIGRWILPSEIVHHKDNNRVNNDINNLELISQNEHLRIHRLILDDKRCKKCQKLFHPRSKKQLFCCKNCKNKLGNYLTKEILEKLIWKFPTIAIAKRFNVSDKAIEKKCKKFNISKPKRGYWQKLASVVQRTEQLPSKEKSA